MPQGGRVHRRALLRSFLSPSSSHEPCQSRQSGEQEQKGADQDGGLGASLAVGGIYFLALRA